MWAIPIKEESEEEAIPFEGPLALSDIPRADPQELIHYINDNGYNWLMMAASHGWLQATKQLLAIGFDANSSNGQKTAVNLAYEAGHYDTVLALLANNSKFPDDFEAEKTGHEGLIKFAQMTEKFHSDVECENLDGIAEAMTGNPNLRHFYGLKRNFNKSAALVALEHDQTIVYALLLNQYVQLAPKEVAPAKANAGTLKELHDKMQLPEPSTFLAALSTNSFIGTGIDKYERGQRHFRVTKALRELNDIPEISPLLQFVARTGSFRIVFDFTRNHWEVEGRGDRGSFHPTKHIYVGARKLLNAEIEQQQDLYGILVRELCVYALELIYKNGGKPYKQKDTVLTGIKGEYDQAVNQCEVGKQHEPIISQAFGEHSIKADLITRVPQLLIHYSKDPMQLAKIRKHYRHLFGFYENRVVDTVVRRMSQIDKIVERRQENFNDTITKNIWTRKRVKALIVAGVLLTAGLLAYFVSSRGAKFEQKFYDVYDCGKVKAKNPAGLMVGRGALDSYPGQWPWLVPLFMYPDENYICGSSLISKWHLLTAAHCTSVPGLELTTNDFFALLGRHNLTDTSEYNWMRRNMSKLFIHPDYNARRRDYRSNCDLSVFRMVQSVTFTDFIQPICFPPPGTAGIDKSGSVAGYGRFIAERVHEWTPKHAELSTKSHTECIFDHGEYAKVVSNRSFCAGNLDASPCAGDSGGGFYVKNVKARQFTITGIVSQGLNAEVCDPADYVVFVNVVDFREWIVEKVSTCDEDEECVSPCALNPCGSGEVCELTSGNGFKCRKG